MPNLTTASAVDTFLAATTTGAMKTALGLGTDSVLHVPAGTTSAVSVQASGSASNTGLVFSSGHLAPGFGLVISGAAYLWTRASNEGLSLHNAWPLSWTSAAADGTPDLKLCRDAAGALAQRNGTNAQTLRVYKTWTSSTNYERGVFDWTTTSNVLTIGTEKGSGGGTARDLKLVTDATERIKITATGAIVLSGLPTSDPSVAGQLWNSAGVLMVSAG